MTRSTMLLLSNDSEVLITIAGAARAAGYVVTPGRYHENGVDSLIRVQPDLAVVDVTHDAADSIAFGGLAQSRGTRVVLFADTRGAPEARARIALISARSPFPVLEYGGDAADLVARLQDD